MCANISDRPLVSKLMQGVHFVCQSMPIFRRLLHVVGLQLVVAGIFCSNLSLADLLAVVFNGPDASWGLFEVAVALVVIAFF